MCVCTRRRTLFLATECFVKELEARKALSSDVFHESKMLSSEQEEPQARMQWFVWQKSDNEEGKNITDCSGRRRLFIQNLILKISAVE